MEENLTDHLLNSPIREYTNQDTWFTQRRFGIMIHWGPYTVPAWSPNNQSAVNRLRYGASYPDIPDACFYRYNMSILGSQTYNYHKLTYGENITYDDFVTIFKQNIEKWNPDSIVNAIRISGAKYCVFTAKHHDGFCMWPTTIMSPLKGELYTSRINVIEILSKKLEQISIPLGIYYSGGFDWNFEMKRINNLVDVMLAIPNSLEYATYVIRHWNELNDNFRNLVIWNDIGLPREDCYHAITTNRNIMINDRTYVINMCNCLRAFLSVFSPLVNFFVNLIYPPGQPFPCNNNSDFKTLEFSLAEEKRDYRWQTVMSITKSFGYNILDNTQTTLSAHEIISILIDVISRGGNFLLNVCPDQYGVISKLQLTILECVGKWISNNYDAVYNSHIWTTSAGFVNVKTAILNNRIKCNYMSDAGKIYIIFEPLYNTNFILCMNDISFQYNITKVELLPEKRTLEYKYEIGIGCYTCLIPCITNYNTITCRKAVVVLHI